MKKFSFFIGCFILAMVCSFVMPVYNNSLYANAGGSVNIYNLDPNQDYTLSSDIDCENNGETFTSAQNYKGTFDGKGHTIKNLTITANNNQDKIGFFSSSNGATIKNVKFENLKIVVSRTVDLYISKVGLLVGEATNTKIENCSFNNCSITVECVSSLYVGNFVGELKDGGYIKNCFVSSSMQVNQTGLGTTKLFYVGGAVGKLYNASVLNTIASGNIKVATKNTSAVVGGFIGYVAGNLSKVINNVYGGKIETQIVELQETEEVTYLYLSEFLGSFIGSISCATDMPDPYSLSYYYSSLKNRPFGNEKEIIEYNNEVAIAGDTSIRKLFPITTEEIMVNNNYDEAQFLRQEFYLFKEENNKTNWDFRNTWDFVKTWVVEKDNITFPEIQNFKTFSFSVNEDKSFETFRKPELSSNNPIILFPVDLETTFDFGKSLSISGKITNENNLNLFFEIVGLRKDNEIIFSNKNAQLISSDGFKETYKVNDMTLIINNVSEQEKEFTYTLDNCDATDKGDYSFVLETIKYEIIVKTENIEKGTIRRKTADASVKEEEVKDTIAYGQRLGYVTTPTQDFAFDTWTFSLEDESKNIKNEDEDIDFEFNEHIFMEGGLFESYPITKEPFMLYAKYTRAVCEITIKFAVNGKILDKNLSTIYINDREVTPDENSVIKYKAKMGQKYTVSVVLPKDCKFSSWFESDGSSKIKGLSSKLTMEVTANDKSDTMIIVADFEKEEAKNVADSSLLWILLGGGTGLVVCVVVVIILVRKKKDNSYKNFY